MHVNDDRNAVRVALDRFPVRAFQVESPLGSEREVRSGKASTAKIKGRRTQRFHLLVVVILMHIESRTSLGLHSRKITQAVTQPFADYVNKHAFAVVTYMHEYIRTL